ncbi:rhodanese-like domain-containing protein [Pseudocolwellia sp. HL-MZ19]|uniref:rhodanese-like domain-containing protein n=1 Tax=Pseudocolwellia sp. HL-MZ19 TaxID=3400846 RepID=UPI003CF40570
MLKTIPTVIADIKTNINITTAAVAFNEVKQNNGVVVDVREPSEVADNVIAGTINIPRGLLEMKMLQLYPNAELPIYIHCSSGVRAVFAAEQLQRVGYKNVKAITCHIDEIKKSVG